MGDVLTRSLSPKGGVDMRRCASKDAGPQRAEDRRGVDMRQCASKDTGPRREWIGGSHIGRRRERVPAKMLGLEGGGL
ncbi:hypothetical protein SDJN02_27629, partial [Cucurbita argyrosperma subsp. argyrosperma]